MTFTPCEQYHAYAAAGHAHFRAPARSAEFITDICVCTCTGYIAVKYIPPRAPSHPEVSGVRTRQGPAGAAELERGQGRRGLYLIVEKNISW